MYTNIIKTHSPKLPLLVLIQSQLLISLEREDEKAQAGKKHNGEKNKREKKKTKYTFMCKAEL